MTSLQAMKSIREKIPEKITLWVNAHADMHTFGRVGWLEVVDDRVVQRVFFYRNYCRKGKTTSKCVECYRKITGDDKVIWRNGYWRITGITEAFTPVFEKKDKTHFSYGYKYTDFDAKDFNKWHTSNQDLFIYCMPIVNLKALENTKYKYCAYPENCDLMRYLAKYEKDNSIEFFGKIGLYPYPSLVSLAKRDRNFCKFLRDNALDADLYGSQATIYAYRNHVSIVEARRICENRNRILRELREIIPEATTIPEATGTELDRERIYKYVMSIEKDGRQTNRSVMSSYNDYLKAVKGLGLDLTDTKNIYPKDFWRMHDLRVDEYASVKAVKDKEKREQLYKDFAKKSQGLKKFEWTNGDLVLVIPSDVSDLIREGDILHHCVGSMGYDVKVIEDKSIIGFIRKTKNVNEPYCTVEYKPKSKSIQQCYGRCDSTPNQEVLDFANKWGEFVTKCLEKDKRKGTAVPVGA